MARPLQATLTLTVMLAALAVALYWATERMKVDGFGPACAAMFSC